MASTAIKFLKKEKREFNHFFFFRRTKKCLKSLEFPSLDTKMIFFEKYDKNSLIIVESSIFRSCNYS